MCLTCNTVSTLTNLCFAFQAHLSSWQVRPWPVTPLFRGNSPPLPPAPAPLLAPWVPWFLSLGLLPRSAACLDCLQLSVTLWGSPCGPVFALCPCPVLCCCHVTCHVMPRACVPPVRARLGFVREKFSNAKFEVWFFSTWKKFDSQENAQSAEFVKFFYLKKF